MRWTIRAKLTGLVLVVLLPLAAGTALNFWYTLAEEREEIQRQMLAAAWSVARHLDEVLAGQIENLEALASVRSLDRIQDEDLRTLAEHVRLNHPFVHRVLTARVDGVIVASSGARVPETPGSFVPAPVLEAVLRERRAAVGPVQPSPADGRLVVPLVVPVLDARGTALGVIVAEIDLHRLSTYLGESGLPEGAAAAVVAEDGTVVARAGRGIRAPGHRLSGDPGAQSLVQRRGGVAEWRREDGVVSLAGAAPLARGPWVVIAAMPSEQAYAPAERRLRRSVVAVGAATLAALLGAWLISRRMSGSVQALIRGVRGLAAGAAAPVAVRARDELAELAEQFNRAVEERHAAEAAVEARQRRLRALAEVNLSLSRQLDLGRLLQQITDALAALTGAHNVVLWEADPAAGTLARRAFTADPSIESVDLPLGVTFEEGGTGWIARHRQPLFVEDVSTDERLRAVDWALRHALVAFAGVPVVAGDDLVGVLTLNLKRGRLPLEDDQALLASFAAQAAVAIRNAQLFAETAQRRREAETLSDVGRALAQALDPDVVAQQVVDSVRALVGSRNSALYRRAPESGDFVAVAVSGEVGSMSRGRAIFAAGTGVVGLALRARHVVATPNLLTDPRVVLAPEARQRLEQAPYRSVLAVPLTVKDQVIGALAVGDLEGREFTPDEIRLAQAFADQAALALDNARLYAEATQRQREAEELALLARMLTESLDVAAVGQRIVESVLPLLGVSSARLGLRRPDDALEIIASSGRARGHFAPGHVVAPRHGVIGRALEEGRPIWTRDVLAESQYPLTAEGLRYVEGTGDRAALAVPFTVKGETIGALILNAEAGRAFTDAEVALVGTFADQAALALDNARLYEETRRRLRQVDSLREVVEQILVPFSLEERLNLVARRVAELFDADRASIALRDEGRGTLVVRAGHRMLEGELGRLVPLGTGALGVAAAERRGLLINDYMRWPLRDPYVVAGYAARPPQAVLAYPLLIREQVIGAIAVGAHAPGRQFVAADLERLASLAAPAALAIEHSRLYEELEARLRELQETQAQLVQAGKLTAVGQLVSGVAHELNNPLSVVIGYGQLLLNRDLPPDLRRPMELIVAQGERMARIVQSLLLFSRQRKPERGPVRVRTAVEQTLNLRVTQLRLSGVRVLTEWGPEAPCVEGDLHQLQQVFLNLVLNAEQAILGSGAGSRRVGDTIRVRTGTALAEGRPWVAVEVEDNGPGIPPDILPRIFDPFFTTKRVGEGSGLGLSVSYGIIQQHGGRLTVDSRPGRTVFTVALPAMSPEAAPAPAAAAPAEPASQGDGRHVLVVDDEPDIVDLVTTLLRERGWAVHVASGGRAALERLRQGRYDLVVSDIRMPDGSGEEFYRAATAERADLAGRFLFLTGDTANPEAWRFIEEHKVPVLEKPFTARALLEAVERLGG